MDLTHDIPEIFDIAQRIAMLDDGVIIFEGSKEDLQSDESKVLKAFVRGETL